MKKNLVLIFQSMLVGFLMVSCEKDEVDNTQPVIDLVQPVTESEYHLGDTIPFECNFSDETELNAYKVEIHYGEDHEHESATLTAVTVKSDVTDEGAEWSYSKTADFVAGETYSTIILLDIIVPDSIEQDGVMEPTLEGEYHIGVYCTDAAGNQSELFTTIDVGDHDH